MSSKPLGIMGVSRIVGWSRLQVYEALCFVNDKVVVVRTATGFQMGWGAGDAVTGWYRAKAQEELLGDCSVEELLSADINNFAIAYDKIEKVELKKFGKGALINLFSEGKKYHWNVHRLSGSSKFEDFQEFLQPLFGEKFRKLSFLKF